MSDIPGCFQWNDYVVFRVNEFGYSAEVAEDTGVNKVSHLDTTVHTSVLGFFIESHSQLAILKIGHSTDRTFHRYGIS